MLRVGPDPNSAPVMIATNLDPLAVSEYLNAWAPYDVLYHGAVQHGRLKPALVSTDEQVVDRRTYFSCAYYNDYLRKHEIKSQLNVCLTGSDSSLGIGPSALCFSAWHRICRWPPGRPGTSKFYRWSSPSIGGHSMR
jgi:hypothetical protein